MPGNAHFGIKYGLNCAVCSHGHHQVFYASVGGATRHTVVVRVCLSVCLYVCLSALVLKDGEESAGGKCNIDTTR